jgi:hypothetical protein
MQYAFDLLESLFMKILVLQLVDQLRMTTEFFLNFSWFFWFSSDFYSISRLTWLSFNSRRLVDNLRMTADTLCDTGAQKPAMKT